MILCSLMEGERSVGELVEKIGLSQSALSQHLARLRRDGLVRTRRCSQTIYYCVAGTQVPTMIETLHRLYCSSPATPFRDRIQLTASNAQAQLPAA
jgi:DNA-binding transcriptional ArsR family regulator